MTKIVFLERDTMWQDMSLFRPKFAHEWVEYGKTDASQIADRLKDADIAILNKSVITADILDACPHLKMIAITATGYNVVDIDACTSRGITVCNARGYAVHTVPELVMSFILSLKKSLPSYTRAVQQGRWENMKQFCFLDYPIQDIHGLTLGIFGAGDLGRTVGKLAQAFGMRVLYADHKGKDCLRDEYTDFDTVISVSDVISVHCPLTDTTNNMIAMSEFERMQNCPLIINTARGGIINEFDTVEALNRGLISGIGFDVLNTEPPSEDNPLLSITDKDNVLITPHVGWASMQACEVLWAQVIENIEKYNNNEAIRVV